MAGDNFMLGITALAVGVIHTLLGPDHYLPFVAMSQAGAWSARKTLGVTVACGLGHVAGSVAIGCVGLLIGAAALRLEMLETMRGDAAAWLFMGFGLAYLVSGLMWATRHAAHENAAAATGWAPWLAFLVFAFGPCEPLIPLLLYPAATAGWGAVAMVVAAFTLATVGTMTITVMAMRHGLAFMPAIAIGRFGHAWAGLAILACGVLVKVGL
jgi:nickel/cobalt exporter